MPRKTPAVRIALGVILVLALALVPAALAGKGGGGKKGGGGTTTGGGTISLAPLVYDANGNGQPNYGDTVTFNISTTATTQPYVNLKCYQNGVLVAEGWDGYFDGSLSSRNFGLAGGSWAADGAAECTAWLDMYNGNGWTQLASTSFHVDP